MFERWGGRKTIHSKRWAWTWPGSRVEQILCAYYVGWLSRGLYSCVWCGYFNCRKRPKVRPYLDIVQTRVWYKWIALVLPSAWHYLDAKSIFMLSSWKSRPGGLANSNNLDKLWPIKAGVHEHWVLCSQFKKRNNHYLSLEPNILTSCHITATHHKNRTLNKCYLLVVFKVALSFK